MIIGKNMYAMLLLEKFFKSFIPGKRITDAKKNAETIVSLSLESRAKVDAMMGKALAAGGKEYRKTMDLGWMYGRAFQDINGHIWEPFYMNERKMPAK